MTLQQPPPPPVQEPIRPGSLQLPVEVWMPIFEFASTSLQEFCLLTTLNRRTRWTLWNTSPALKADLLQRLHPAKDLVRKPAFRFLFTRDGPEILRLLLARGVITPKTWPSAVTFVLQIDDDVQRRSLLPVFVGAGFQINPGGVVEFLRRRPDTPDGGVEECRLCLDHADQLVFVPGRLRAFHASLMTAAAHTNNTPLLRFLLQDRGVPVDVVDREGRSALHVAAMANHVEAVTLLLDATPPADPELRDFYARRPLENCVVWGAFGAALALVRRGAGFAERAFYLREPGNAAAAVAAAAGEGVGVSQHFLLREPENLCMPLVHVAAADGALELVKECVERVGREDAEVDKTTPEGRSAVHLAAWFGHHEVVRYLVGVGVEVGGRDKRGRTAAFYAEKNGHPETVKVLVELGCEPPSPI
ncbi:hypothetical protein HDU96_006128 [Phlyctochytrium bullatum]|nr:hypothetical protein HDU96_006128 [Phlyctochytrium bullatum]